MVETKLEDHSLPTSADSEVVPSIKWQVMNVDRYATFEQALGTKLLRTEDIWWSETRPFFYRPLQPLGKYDKEHVRQCLDRKALFQHAVLEGQSHNSYLNAIVFDDVHNYDPAQLRKNCRSSLRKALRSGVCARRLLDESEFCEKGYRTYLAFYERTKYRFHRSRRGKEEFWRWTHTLFQFPEVVVIGVLDGPELLSYIITCLVENTLVLKSLITSDSALKVAAPDLLLHTCRLSALGDANIRQIYCGMLGREGGFNQFKMQRGAHVLALPAFLNLCEVALWSLRKVTPAIHSKLCGIAPASLATEVRWSRPWNS